MKKMLLMIVAVIVLGTAAQAAFNEDFDTFSLGTLTAQESWEARTDMDVVATTSSGEYIGGRALSPNNTSDKTTRHDGTGVDFALTVDQGGIEYGFDIREDFTSAVNTVLYPREGRTANYGPSVGLAGGYFAIRPNATSGDTFTGNWIGSANWAKGDWVRIWIKLTGVNFANATVYCYNLTQGVMIDTGLANVDMGVDVASKAASWTGLNFRMSVSTQTYVDNAYIQDIAPASYVEDFESETLGSINQAGWRDNAPDAEVVNSTSSGEYVGSQALQSNISWIDQWPQYELTRSENFGLNIGSFSGLELGFDYKETSTSASCRIHFREGITGNYGPAFGLNGGSFAIRPTGESGTTYTGNSLADAVSAGTWAAGDWIEFTLILRGSNYSYATLYAYNLTQSVDIATGLVNINTGIDYLGNASAWDRLIMRMGNPTDSQVDNIYISDYVDTDVLAKFPDPSDGEYPVLVDSTVTLSWLGALSADSHKVYFGTDPEALTLETDTTNEYYDLPYALDKGTTYYWRVDEVVGGVEYEGIVWSFDTVLEALNYPRRMAYEGFDYTEYLQLSQTTNNGGFGWDTGWERNNGGWCYVQIGPGSLQPSMDYLLGTTGNKVQHIAGGVNDDGMRQLSYPIDARADQDYYISYLAMADWDQYNSVAFGLYEEKNGAYLFRSHMFYQGYPGVSTPQFALRDDQGGWLDKLFGSWTGGTVYVVVVKISTVASGDDTVSISVFDPANPLPVDEPTVWDQSFTTQSNKVYPWININGRATASDKWYVDEIHVGTGWGAVTGWASACGDFGTIMNWDLNEDCYVDLGDYSVLASDWLKSTDPSVAGSEWVIDENDPNFASLFTVLPESELKVYENDAITVDGDLSDWDNVRWYKSRFTSGYQTANIDDITAAEMALKWDPANPDVVYAAIKVTDTNQSFATTPDAWNAGDNIEIRFSLNDTSTSTLWYDNATFDTAQYYQVFPLSGGGSQAYLGSVGLDPQQSADVYTELSYAVAVSGDVIIYEMAIPVYSSYDINTQSGTLSSLSDGDVVAFNLQINSVNGAEFGGLFPDQSHTPDDWPAFTAKLNSSLPLGAFGFFDADIDENGIVGESDLDTIIEKWLSCTDPEGVGCDQPWLP